MRNAKSIQYFCRTLGRARFGTVLKRHASCAIFLKSRRFEDIKYDTESDFGKIWQLMASNGKLWQVIATYGSLWQLRAFLHVPNILIPAFSPLPRRDSNYQLGEAAACLHLFPPSLHLTQLLKCSTTKRRD